MRHKALFASVVALLLLAGMLQAQIPAIAEIPFDLGPVGRYHELLHKRNALLQRKSALAARISGHNSQCSEVPEGSSQAQACRQSRADLETEKTSYIAAVNKFNREVEEAAAAWKKEQARPPVTRVGGAGEVRGDVFWVTPSGKRVPVRSGSPIFLGAHIVTGPSAHLQVLLLDESVFTLGPDSDMVMDEFVYDPATSVGAFTAKLTKGVFRFVTGKVARPQHPDMHIRIPTGCLGIRGTDVEVSVAADNSGYIKLFSGEIEMMNHKTGAVFALHAGQMVALNADGTMGQPAPIP